MRQEIDYIEATLDTHLPSFNSACSFFLLVESFPPASVNAFLQTPGADCAVLDGRHRQKGRLL